MPMSVQLCSCSCPSQGSIVDLLRCAPCPPPMISYEEFRDHALNRSLLLKEVCIIARRCNINSTDIVVDCPPVTQPEHGALGVPLGTLCGLIMIIIFIGIYVVYKRISKRSYDFVHEHALKAGGELPASDTSGERLETEDRSGHVSFTETSFIVHVEDTIHFHENIINTEESIKERRDLVDTEENIKERCDETLDKQFYSAEEVISVENDQLEKLKKYDSDDKKIEANINQNDVTEMVHEILEAIDQLIIETSVQKTSDPCRENSRNEEEDDNEAYYSANENEDIPFI